MGLNFHKKWQIDERICFEIKKDVQICTSFVYSSKLSNSAAMLAGRAL